MTEEIKAVIRRRFMRKVRFNFPTGCWEWSGAKLPKGYARMRYGGRNYLAHRVSYELHIAPIPEGMLCCHACDNPSCVNPGHLFIGTMRDNFDDMLAKYRTATGRKNGSHTRPDRRPRGASHGSKTKPDRVPRGEQSGGSKLTDKVVQSIMLDLRDNVLQDVIARKHGVTQSTISDINTGRSWSHLRKSSDGTTKV